MANNVAVTPGTGVTFKTTDNAGIHTGHTNVDSLPASTNTLEVVGDVAHDAVAAGNPILMGGYASAAAPTDVSADADAVRAWRLRNGAAATVITAAGALVGGDATNGLDVDVTRLPALVAGTANIGDVDVLTVPADPFGVNADVAVAAGAAGSMQAKLRLMTTQLDAIKTATETIYTEGATDATITGPAIMWEDATDTLRAVSAAKPLPVNVISGSAAGTQYTEGATDATIDGTAIMWEDTSDTLRAVSAAKPLPISVISGGVAATFNANGQATMANSAPITIASNQSALSTTPTAGELHIGEVGGKTVMRTITMTPDTAVMGAADIIADTQQLDAAFRKTDGTGVLQSMTVFDPDDNAAFAFDVYVHRTSTSMGSENAAISISDANAAAGIIGVISFATTDYKDLINGGMYHKSNLGLPVQAVSGTDDLYFSVRNGSGTPTFAGGSMPIVVGILQD